VETSRLLDGEVTIRDGAVAYTLMTGDPDRAGFVQVIQGRNSDLRRFRELLRAEEPFLSCRPDCLGQTVLEHDENAWTMALFGTTEDEVRAEELKAMPAEWQAVFAEQQLMIGGPEFFDLWQPWLLSALGFRPPGLLGLAGAAVGVLDDAQVGNVWSRVTSPIGTDEPASHRRNGVPATAGGAPAAGLFAVLGNPDIEPLVLR